MSDLPLHFFRNDIVARIATKDPDCGSRILPRSASQIRHGMPTDAAKRRRRLRRWFMSTARPDLAEFRSVQRTAQPKPNLFGCHRIVESVVKLTPALAGRARTGENMRAAVASRQARPCQLTTRGLNHANSHHDIGRAFDQKRRYRSGVFTSRQQLPCLTDQAVDGIGELSGWRRRSMASVMLQSAMGRGLLDHLPCFATRIRAQAMHSRMETCRC